MTTVYRNEVERVSLKLFVSGEPEDADSLPTLSVVTDLGEEISQPVVTHDSDGEYSAVLGPADTGVVTNPILVWTYTLLGNQIERRELLSVVQPYLTIDEVASVAPATASYEDLVMAEKYARLAIDSFCGQSFYPYNSTVYAIGQGHPILPLTQRLLSVDKISAGGVDLYSSDVNDLYGRVSISSTSRAVQLLSTEYDELEGGLITSGRFRQGTRYEIHGVFGWYDVPEAVSSAAKLLVNDFFCKESTWRNRYIESISASDWRIVFDAEGLRGTGNATADHILTPYIAVNWAVV